MILQHFVPYLEAGAGPSLEKQDEDDEEGEEGDQEGTTDAPENSMLLFCKRKTNFALSCDQFQAMIDFLPKSSTRLFHF